MNSRHPQKVNKLCKQVVSQCSQHQIAEQIGALQLLSTFEPCHYAKMESIDAQLTCILLKADCTCSLSNSASWSPNLNQAYLCHQLWTIALLVHHNQCDMSSAIATIRAQLLPSPLDAQEIQLLLLTNL